MRLRTLFALTLLSCTAVCFAQSSPKYQGIAEKQPINHPLRGVEPDTIPQELLPSRPKVLIPELTEIRLVLRDDIKSGFTQIGSEVLFQVAEDVYAPGPVLVLTKGTPAIGYVVKSNGHDIFGQSGHLFLTCNYILAQDHSRIPLRSVEKQGRGQGFTGAAWFVGVIGGLLLHGKNTTLHSGREFIVHTEKDTAVISPLPYSASASVEPDTDESTYHLSQKYQSLKHYPTVHLTFGRTLTGVVKKDTDGKMSTIYGPLREISRVPSDEIVSIDP